MPAHSSFSKLNMEKMGKFAPRRQKEKKEEQEFGAGKKEYQICEKCSAAYYDKSWHHRLEDVKHFKHEERKTLNFVLCPACKLIKDKRFEGSVAVNNVPPKIKNDLVNLIKNAGAVAFSKDPMDRIIEIKQTKSGIEATFTENQLAKRAAKQITRAFKQYSRDCEIKMSEREDVIRVVINFASK